jgi:hypothetical protein
MKKLKGKRVTRVMLEDQFELLDGIAHKRGWTKNQILYDAIQSYTWAYIQKRGTELRAA